MTELVDVADSKFVAVRHVGSSPATGISLDHKIVFEDFLFIEN